MKLALLKNVLKSGDYISSPYSLYKIASNLELSSDFKI